MRLAHEETSREQADDGDDDPEVEGLWTERVCAAMYPVTHDMTPTAKYPANSFSPSARPRRLGPTRSIFMITVIDHAIAWFAPSNTLARSIHHHAGA